MIDSVSTDHIAFARKLFVGFREKKGVVLISIGEQLQIKEVGMVLIEVINKKRQKDRLQLETVPYVR